MFRKKKRKINLFNNKRLSKGLQKIKEIIKNPRVELSPIRILPATDINDNCTCQLIFNGPEDISEFKSSVRFMKGIKIGDLKEDERVAMDVNDETRNKIFIAPDWHSTEKYIKENNLEKKLKRSIYNEDKDKEFTAYVHDGRTSKLVSNHINSLSMALKNNLNHLKKLKVMRKKVQGALYKSKFHCIARTAKYYESVAQHAKRAGLMNEAMILQDILDQVKDLPRNEVHVLKEKRHERNEMIQQVLTWLDQISYTHVGELTREFKVILKLGKKIHRRETELRRGLGS